MRKKLEEIGSEDRHVFKGFFKRTGIKSGYKGPVETVLLVNVRDDQDNLVTDHLWFNLTKGFTAANMKEGDEVQFRARVQPYLKGYFGRREDVYCPIEQDYKLSYPSQIVNLSAKARI